MDSLGGAATGWRLAGRVRQRRMSAPANATTVSHERIDALDRELVRFGRSAGCMWSELGRGLEAMERSGRLDAGFPSIEAYALERCERSSSWVQKSRRLARRLEGLPLTRASLISGQISWSVAAALASVATLEDEERWLADAERSTLRELKALVAARRSSDGSSAPDASESDEPLRTLTLSVPQEDA